VPRVASVRPAQTVKPPSALLSPARHASAAPAARDVNRHAVRHEERRVEADAELPDERQGRGAGRPTSTRAASSSPSGRCVPRFRTRSSRLMAGARVADRQRARRGVRHDLDPQVLLVAEQRRVGQRLNERWSSASLALLISSRREDLLVRVERVDDEREDLTTSASKGCFSTVVVMGTESISRSMNAHAPRTGLVRHAVFQRHDTGRGHPERARRVSRRSRSGSSRRGLMDELDVLEPDPAAGRVAHARPRREPRPARGAALRVGSARPRRRRHRRLGSELGGRSLAAGGAPSRAVDRVMDGVWRSAFVACRPPGHHAERSEAMGFCPLQQRRRRGGAPPRWRAAIERVAILDWDVHHGNGRHCLTQPARVRVGRVRLLRPASTSTPWYPGTGAADERRHRPAGEGCDAELPAARRQRRTASGWRAIETQMMPGARAVRSRFRADLSRLRRARTGPAVAHARDDGGLRRMTDNRQDVRGVALRRPRRLAARRRVRPGRARGLGGGRTSGRWPDKS